MAKYKIIVSTFDHIYMYSTIDADLESFEQRLVEVGEARVEVHEAVDEFGKLFHEAACLLRVLGAHVRDQLGHTVHHLRGGDASPRGQGSAAAERVL